MLATVNSELLLADCVAPVVVIKSPTVSPYFVSTSIPAIKIEFAVSVPLADLTKLSIPIPVT